MKKIICIFIVLLLSTSACYAVDISAGSAILYDCFTGQTIYEKKADEQRLIASTTKIMTAFIASEIYDLDKEVEIKKEWCGIEGSSMYLKEGEKLRIRDLIYGLMLTSGNDAAVALSCIYTGKAEDFIALMNKKAEELSLQNTHFANPSGLDEMGHYSCARDLATITEAALKNSFFASVCATKQCTIGDRFLSNHNKLLFKIPGALGVKTGYTEAAGRCLVSAVCRDDRTLIAVTLDAPDDWNDHEKLYEIGFYDLRKRTVIEKGLVGYVNVAGRGTTAVYLHDDININLSQEEIDRLEVGLKGDRIVYGGFEDGEQYGIISVVLDGRTLLTEPVYYSETIAVETPRYSFWEKILMHFSKG